MSSSPPVEWYARAAKHAALNDAASLTAALRSLAGVPPDFSATLRYQHLATTMLATLEDAGALGDVDAKVAFAMKSARPKLPTAATLLHAFDDLRQALAASGIEAVLLKGVYFAERLYGGYHRRPQFDLDVLVRARQRREARRALEALGYRRQTYDLHSETYEREVMKADVHGWLRRAPAYRIDEDDVWRGVHLERIGNTDVPTLNDEYSLVMLGLSCFEDLGQGMIRLKPLIDLFLLLRQIDEHTDWGAFWAQRQRERIDGVLGEVFALTIALLEAKDELPHLCGTLSARHHRLDVARREEAIRLVSAPRKHAGNLAWFRGVYPGNFWRYLAWFWMGGFPDNLHELRSGRLMATLRVAFSSPSPTGRQ